MAGLWAVILLVAPVEEISIEPLSGPRDIEVRLRIPGELKIGERARGVLEGEVGRRFLTLALRHEDGTVGAPIFARYEIQPPWLVLKPRYGLSAGATYVATAILPNGRTWSRTYQVPAEAKGESPRVTAVFPSGERLPANCLKFYLHFSRPMREGREIFDQIQILDDQRNAVDDPWRRTELWSEDARRLTLWIHPGRIKQGVNLREELGPVLEPDRDYLFVVTTSLQAADGTNLAEPYVKRFRTTVEDRERPLPERWHVTPPRQKTRDSLQVQFGEPLDRPLLDRFLTVYGAEGPIAGRIVVAEHETHWSFLPDQPWKPGRVELRVDGRLEDLAGNTPLRVFDNDLSTDSPPLPLLRLPIPLRPQDDDGS